MQWTICCRNAHQPGFDRMLETSDDWPKTKEDTLKIYKAMYPTAKILWVKKGDHVPDLRREGWEKKS